MKWRIMPLLALSSFSLAIIRKHSNFTRGRSSGAICILAIRALATGFGSSRKSRQFRRLSWITWKWKSSTADRGTPLGNGLARGGAGAS